MPAENCVSVRARVRKSKRSIDPEFDSCQETLVSFVDGKDPKSNGPSLLLTPAPPARRARSLSRGNMAPVKRRNRSFNPPQHVVGLTTIPSERLGHARKQSTTSLCSSDICNGGDYQRSATTDGVFRRGASGASGGSDIDAGGMSDGEEGTFVGGGDAKNCFGSGVNGSGTSGGCPLNESQHSHPLLPNKPGLPPQPMTSSQRYASPLAVHRTSSGASANGGGSVVSSAHSDVLSASARSRSSSATRRSRSGSRRRMGGHLRRRSASAAGVFAAATPAVSGDEELDASLHGPPAEPISIPLKDILSVDEEIPNKAEGSSGGWGGSDFFSSSASDVEVAKEAKEKAKESGEAGSKAGIPPRLSSPSPPPSTTGSKIQYRIFLHTLSHGYVEFSLENSNSHDIFMAYLKADLEPDRIPDRDKPRDGPGQLNGSLMRTMVLTPTKEVPSNLSSSERTHQTQQSTATAPKPTASASDPGVSFQPPPAPRPSLPRPQLNRSNSTISCNIDKLHSKVIKQRLQNESTPMHRMKESIAGWVSTMMDCACCQDTTVAPLDASSVQGTPDSKLKTPKKGVGGLPPSPNSCRLKSKGIGGLSFEVESCGGTPKLSFERSSVGGESVKRL